MLKIHGMVRGLVVRILHKCQGGFLELDAELFKNGNSHSLTNKHSRVDAVQQVKGWRVEAS